MRMRVTETQVLALGTENNVGTDVHKTGKGSQVVWAVSVPSGC